MYSNSPVTSLFPLSYPTAWIDCVAVTSGAKAYYMRYILHDYADPPAIAILKVVADAMSRDSRILIGEVIVPERVTEANIDATVFDQILLAIGGKERTARNFAELLHDAGLEIVTIHYVEGTVGGLIEARLK